ncbi:MAG: succinylglutamate desuccinylase/aspartoacylase family protein [Gemmatimonadota bacterium]|nr:MAG: succinylglutamate desuccinylase/aspartoacylase family protein [Gemmatimonadota bacterium]
MLRRTRVAALGVILSACMTVTAMASAFAQAADRPFTELTRPERTDYRETSSYTDVMEFVERVVDSHPWMHLTTVGYTMEGRALPVVVVGDLPDASPEAVRATGKLRVYVQANIHAGEVCGKEALQVLLRSLAEGRHHEWRDSLVLLVAPIYNADGNERVKLTNRHYQHGPIAGMGQRYNAQGLDLNRDNTKLETPEARSLVAYWNRYDPHIIIDLHTTNGTRHAYRLNYAPPLHPNTDARIIELARARLLPEVTRALKAKYDWDYYYYGNLPWRSGDAERGWYTFSHMPRFLTNYVGLRNRIGILSEAYSYATFEDRILATLRFVEEFVEVAYRRATAIASVIERADETDVVGEELALRATVERSDEPVEILMGDVVQERNPYSGEPMFRRLDVRRPEAMPEFGTFRPTETELVPAAYLVPGELTKALNVLSDHGIRWEELAQEETRVVQRFVIDSTSVSQREYQGHTQRTLFGHYEAVEVTVPAGTVVVPVDQPLGRLVFSLLEPRSDDGLANWNFFDEALEEAEHFPVLRVIRPSGP